MKMTKKIIAIGNAIVDVACLIEDDFLAKNSLIKGSMSLIDDEMVKNLSKLKVEKITSGGSASNSIAALSQLGVRSAFIGKVGNDKIADIFIKEIEKTGCEFFGEKTINKTSAQSFILVSPDSERTMCTYLGCACEIKENDIKEEFFKDCEIFYLEGYLWDCEETIKAMKKAIFLAKKNKVKIAFSLSDSFCVARHKADFIDLVENQLDFLFANKNEAKELDENYQSIFAKNPSLIAAVTDSQNGCEIFEVIKSDQNNEQNNLKITSVASCEIEKLTDSTGAGDAFAAGFMFGYLKNQEIKKCAELANLLASMIIQKIGARFEKSEIDNFLTKII
jgi:fructokinase